MGDARLGDEGLVGCVKKDNRALGIGIVHPGLQLCLGGHHAGGVVGVAEIDDINFFLGDGRGKVVCLGAGQIDKTFVVAFVVCFAGSADHDIGVVVDRIYRIADGDLVCQGKDIEDIGAVAFGAVGDEDLRRQKVHAKGLV